MKPEQKPTGIQRLKTLIIGGKHNIEDTSIFHKLALIAFFAWVGLGADGLSSSCYGPEEAFLAFKGHVYLSVFVALMSGITVFIIAASYSQIIELFPTGGGGYLVASKLLSPTVGMISGSALLIDYVLTITISVASGADALFSFLPPAWLPYKLTFALLGVLALTVMNMRGVKESVLPLVPIFLTFVITHAFIIGYAVIMNLGNLGAVASATRADVIQTQAELGIGGMLLLILRAYSMGAGTYTGIEAVSNGLPILREPKVRTGKRTMRYMAISLAITVMGLMIAYLLYRVVPQSGKTLNAVLFETMTQGLGQIRHGVCSHYAALGSGAPVHRGPGGLSGRAACAFEHGARPLVPDQVRHALRPPRDPERHPAHGRRGARHHGADQRLGEISRRPLQHQRVHHLLSVPARHGAPLVAGPRQGGPLGKEALHQRRGHALTSFILVSVIVLKFYDGGWITLILTGSLIAIALLTKRHYRNTHKLLHRLDELVNVAESSCPSLPIAAGTEKELKIKYDPQDKTAVLLVNGFNGLGLHTLFSIIRLFGGTFKNFVFIQVGIVDAGNFKGAEEVTRMRTDVKKELDRYVNYMRCHGYYAAAYSAFGTDVVDEIARVTPEILERFPNAILFGGQLVFPKTTFLSGVFHNYTIFAVQRRFYSEGIPVVILPIRV